MHMSENTMSKEIVFINKLTSKVNVPLQLISWKLRSI